MSRTLSLSSACAVNAVTATGTSWIVSSRLRAVTVTVSSVVASLLVAAVGALSCANATGAARLSATARLRVLRFNVVRMCWFPIRYVGPAAHVLEVHALEVHGTARDKPRGACLRAASYLRTMGRPRRAHDTRTSWTWPVRPGIEGMAFLIVLAALCFLMFVAYRGHSVILFAPVAALGAVLLTDPSLVAPMFTGLFMDKMVGFLKLYFPVFLLGAIFGKVIELSGFSKAIVAATIRIVGAQRAMLSIVLVCALLTYGGVSLFVVVFAVYPFAAELFRQSDIPKRLIH